MEEIREREKGNKEKVGEKEKEEVKIFFYLGFRVSKSRIYTLCDFSKRSFIFAYFESYYRYLTDTTYRWASEPPFYNNKLKI